MKRSFLILALSIAFIIGTIASSPNIAKAATSGWQASVEEISMILDALSSQIQQLSQDTFDLDIVVRTGNLNDITTLVRDSSGKIQRFDYSSTLGSSRALTVNDFDNDGNQDLVLVGQVSGTPTISVLLGLGDGTFSDAILVNAASSMVTVANGDFDGISTLDLAVGSFDKVETFLGDGSGGFSLSGTFSTGETCCNPNDIAVGDLNGDGQLDIVTSVDKDRNVTLLLLDGSPDKLLSKQTFLMSASISSRLESIVVADIYGDGALDIIGAISRPEVSILNGTGMGNFDPPLIIPLQSSGPKDIAVGDFDKDGKLDIVIVNSSSDSITLLLNRGGGTFEEREFATPNFHQNISVGDVNGDGNLDVVTSSRTSNLISILLGNGDGRFDPIVNDYRIPGGAEELVIANLNSTSP